MNEITAAWINRDESAVYFRFVKFSKERDMTNEKPRNAADPSIAVITAKLLLLFVCVSLALGFVATRTGLLPDGMTPLDPIVAWATTN
jgi:hypothetical protein